MTRTENLSPSPSPGGRGAPRFEIARFPPPVRGGPGGRPGQSELSAAS